MNRVRVSIRLAFAALSLSFGMVGCGKPASTAPTPPSAVPPPYTALDIPRFQVQAEDERSAMRATAMAIVEEVCLNRIYYPCLRSGHTKTLCLERGNFCVRYVAYHLRQRGYPI
jgi:hypothetical protein